MNKLIFFFGIMLVAITGCTQHEKDFYLYPDVDSYIEMLKDGTYNVTDGSGIRAVPNFHENQINDLLYYVEDLTVLPQNYPISPISSAVGPTRLGEGILWTIEGIARKNKYPSYSGHLVKEEIIEGKKVYTYVTDEELLEVAKLYKLWWNGLYPFNRVHDKKTLCPLEGTPYTWN